MLLTVCLAPNPNAPAGSKLSKPQCTWQRPPCPCLIFRCHAHTQGDNFNFCTTPLTVCLNPASNASQPCLSTPVTRAAGSVIGSGTVSLLSACVAQQGWMSPYGAQSKGCGLSPPALTLSNVTFNQPEDLASMFPSTRGRAAPMAAVQAQARAMLTDVQAAADSLWAVSQRVFASTLFIKSVPPSRIPALQ